MLLLDILPASDQVHDKVGRVALVQQLAEKVQIGDECRLQDDGHVRGVEQLDGVRGLRPPLRAVLHGKINAEALEVDDDHEDAHRREQVGNIGQILAVESLLERAELARAGDEEMEERNHGTLEL